MKTTNRQSCFISMLARLCKQFMLLLLPGLLLVVNVSQAQTEEQVAEYSIKGAYLYKFADYVEWPAEAFVSEQSPLVIGVLGSELMADLLPQIVQGRTAKGYPVVVRNLEQSQSIDGIHVLFVGSTVDGATIEAFLSGALNRSILVITENTNQAARDFSIIRFENINNKVRFMVALAPARQARLTVSSRLLQVASRVIE